MQDRYVGDVRDFVKYGLLRWLCGRTGTSTSSPLKLGVVWYRVDPKEVDGKEAGGGGLTAYLQQPQEWHRRDETLFEALRKIRAREDRTVLDVEDSGLLGEKGKNAFFLSESWSFLGIPKPRRSNDARRRCGERRQEMQCKALELVKGADVVFLDPDNGVYPNHCQSVPASDTSLKYALPGEVAAFSAAASTTT